MEPKIKTLVPRRMFLLAKKRNIRTVAKVENLITAQAFGLELRKRRKARGWTLQQAGEKVGVSLKTWGDYESGNSIPSLQVYFNICRAFKAGKIPLVSTVEENIP